MSSSYKIIIRLLNEVIIITREIMRWNDVKDKKIRLKIFIKKNL